MKRGIWAGFIGFVLSLGGEVWAYERAVSVMSYNVENLFDTVHDEGKTDWTYLPLAWKKNSSEVQSYCQSLKNVYYKLSCVELDWNEEVLKNKIQNLAAVMKSYNHGWTADIIVLQEVENMNVLRKLRDWGLKNQGLDTLVLIEGPDKRGIDVAIMSRFPLYEEAFLHKVVVEERSNERDTELRGILQATFDVFGQPVSVLANHWPSQGNPDHFRNKAAQILREVALKSEGRSIIAAGDFNTLPSDNPNGLDNWVTNQSFNRTFDDPLENLNHHLVMPGSYWYRGRWIFLDRFFIWNSSPFFPPPWYTFQVLVRSWMLKDVKVSKPGHVDIHEDIPWRFNPKNGRGYSDHLPIVMQFHLR